MVALLICDFTVHITGMATVFPMEGGWRPDTGRLIRKWMLQWKMGVSVGSRRVKDWLGSHGCCVRMLRQREARRLHFQVETRYHAG